MTSIAKRAQTAIKQRAKTALESITPLLPRDARDAIAGVLTSGGSYEYGALLQFAKRFNVESLSVRGDYGVFRSTVDDLTVLGEYATTGIWAKETNDQLQRFFDAAGPGTYVDVGANIGLTTVPISKKANVVCYALEPEPTNYSNLVENVRRNVKTENVTLLQMAGFNKRAMVDFEIATSNLGDHRIHLTDEPGILNEHNRQTIQVQAAPLDEIIPPVEGPFAIKMDTQGAEPFIIEGGKATLERADLLIMEFWPYGMIRLGADPERIYDYLESRFSNATLTCESKPVHDRQPIKNIIGILREFAKTEATYEHGYLDITASH